MVEVLVARPANTGCCSHGGRRIVNRTVFSAAAVQQNPVSLGGLRLQSPRSRFYFAVIAALSLGALVRAFSFEPLNPVPPWIFALVTTVPFEQWWYTSARSIPIYNAGVALAELVYPIVVAGSFWLWCAPLKRDYPYPRRTSVLAAVLVCLSVLYYAVNWRAGLKYQGLFSLLRGIGLSTLALCGVAAVWRAGRNRASWPLAIAAHWALFAWWWILALPWLGESI